jgi:hypothetical protein
MSKYIKIILLSTNAQFVYLYDKRTRRLSMTKKIGIHFELDEDSHPLLKEECSAMRTTMRRFIAITVMNEVMKRRELRLGKEKEKGE